MGSVQPEAGGRKKPGGAEGLAPEAVRVWLLGGFRVSVGSRPIGQEEWRLRKAASLVKLLALAPGHRLHREQATEALWPASSPDAAANSLYRALHFARKALGSSPAARRYIELRNELLTLCPVGQLWVDVEAFEEAAREARRIQEPSAYRAAIELYAGDLLPEDRYEGWAEERRTQLRSTYLDLLVGLARLHEERGEYERGIEALRKVVAGEPTREEAHAALMRQYALRGQRADALGQYRRLQEILSRQLGVEPDPETGRLREEIASGRFPATATRERCQEEISGLARHNLRVQRTSFVGRVREMAELKRLLSMTGLLTLTGAGGAGKTRLALEVARELVGVYPDGVWLVELASLSEGALVAQEVAAAIGVREQPGRPITETLAEHLRDKRALLILDNCEHLLDATAGLVDALLGTCAHLRILATSREALGVAGEANWPVPPLSVPATDGSPADLMRCEAVRLFVERARLRLPTFDLTPSNAPAVAEVCRKLDGIPLAIELVTRRVAALAVEQVAEKLEDALGLLTTGPRTATPRHQTMRATIEWSHALLGEREQALFRRLSVFAGGWALEAAEEVCSGNGVERDDVLDLLGRLVDKSLVVAMETSHATSLRYRMLEPIRQYASEKLEESGEADSVRSRHAVHYLALAEEAEPELQGAQAERWLGQLETEHDNLRAALSWVLGDGERELGLRLAGTLGVFWQMRGHLTEACRWLGAALSEDGTPAPTRVKALARAAFMGVEQGEFERSISFSEEALALSRETGDEAGAAAALYNLGYAAMFQEKLDKARPMFEEAAALRRKLGDKVGLAYALQGLGLTVMVQGDFERAVALFDGGLVLAREAGDMAVTELLLLALALAALGQDEYGRAREFCAEAVELARRLDYGHATAANLHVLASVAGSEGQPVRAARLWGAAEALREEIGATLSPVERTFYARYIAAARERLDDAVWKAAWAAGRKMTPEEAVEYGLPAEEPDLPASPRSARIKALSWASWMAWEQGGDFERAAALGEEGLALARETGDPAGIVAGLQNLGIVALRQNELGRSRALFEEAIALQRETGDTVGVARSLQALGLIAVVRRDHERAQALFEEGLALNQETGDKMGTVLLLALGALTALGRGEHRRARELCEQGVELSWQFGMRHPIIFHLQILACLAGAQGQAVRAARLWGAIDALGETIGVRLVPVERYHYGPYIDAARERLDAASWEKAWAEGRAMSLEQAIEHALTEAPQTATPQVPPVEVRPIALTPREREVASLVARGLTNRQIAAQLHLSRRTVDTHVYRILRKLGLHSREQVASRLDAQYPLPEEAD